MGLPSGVEAHWPKDGSLPPYVQEFVDWLCMPVWERPADEESAAAWCRKRDISTQMPVMWKRKPAVKKAIEKRCDELNLAPDRIQAVLNAIYRQATAGDVKAATLYLQHADRLAPKRLIIEDRSIAKLSDDELRDALESQGLLSR